MRRGHRIRYGSVLLALALGLLIGGCATTRGREINQSLLQRLKPGQTTEREVRTLLGAPQGTAREGNRTVLRYSYSWDTPVPRGWAWTKRDQRLDVVLDEQNRVWRYSFVEDRAR